MEISSPPVAITSSLDLFQRPISPAFTGSKTIHPNMITPTGTIQPRYESADPNTSTLNSISFRYRPSLIALRHLSVANQHQTTGLACPPTIENKGRLPYLTATVTVGASDTFHLSALRQPLPEAHLSRLVAQKPPTTKLSLYLQNCRQPELVYL